MKIACTASGPDLDCRIEPRFGRCPFFIIVDPDTMEFEALENPNITLGGGAGIQSAQLMAQKEVTIVLTGNCGPNAFQVFGSAGIQVITGVSGLVRDAIHRFKSGTFSSATAPNVASHFGMGTATSSPGQPEPGEAIGGSMSPGGGFNMGRGGGRGMGMGGGRGMGMGGGRGMGMGGGRGMGMGSGRGMGMGAGMGGVMPQDFTQQYSDMLSREQVPDNEQQEIAMLQEQSKALNDQIGQVNARLQQLRQASASSGLIAHVSADRCTGCSRCMGVCPAGAVRMDGNVAMINQNVCTGCGRCANVCPQNAITLN